MDHIPTDIFEDLLNDVVGNRYSGPPLAASDLRVLSGPQPQINLKKAADEQFAHHPILGQRRQYDRVLSGLQPQINLMKAADEQFAHHTILGQRWQYDRDFAKMPAYSHPEQYHGHSWLSYFSRLEATRPTNLDSYTERPSFSSTIKYVKPDHAENKNGASTATAKKWPTSSVNASPGTSHAKDTCATVPGIDAQLADPECLLMIKNLLQYSYNKWRLNNYDAAKPHFWFLFENTSEEYKYYRLKLTQLLKLKNVTVDTESQSNGHESTKTSMELRDSTVKDIDFLKLKRIQTSTLGTQTDLKMHMFNRSLDEIIQHPPKQSPAVPELLNSQIIASQHPAPSKMANAPEAFHKDERDVNPKTFTPGHTLQPLFLSQQISAPRELLSQQSISQNKMVPCPPPATPNAPLASQKQRLMETIKSVTTKLHVDSKSSVDVQFSGIDEITKKALQNLANVHVISQEQNRGFERLKGPAYWFLKEKLSPVYKYYRMKVAELRQARGLPDDHLECEIDSEALDVDASEPQVSEADHPESQGSEAEHPEALSPDQKQPELKGCGNKRPKILGSEYRQSEPNRSGPCKSEPDKFELLVTCSDDESDAEVSSPLIREPGQPQVLVPKSHQPDEKLPLQNLEPHSSLLQDVSDLVLVTEEDPWKPVEELDLTSEASLFSGKAPQSLNPKPLQANWKLTSQYLKPQQKLHQNHLELVPDPVSSQPHQEMKSDFTESTSEEGMQITTVKQSPVSRKRGRLPKGVTVPPKRMHPAEDSTDLIKPESKKPEGSEDLMKTKSKEGTSSIDRTSPERGTKEVLDPSPEKTQVKGPGNETPTSSNVELIVSKKRMTRLSK